VGEVGQDSRAAASSFSALVSKAEPTQPAAAPRSKYPRGGHSGGEMCCALCRRVPGLQPRQAWLCPCHRLGTWTMALLRDGFGVSDTPVGPRDVSGQEVRVAASARRS